MLSSHCPLSSKLRDWLTSAMSTIFSAEIFWGMLRIKPGAAGSRSKYAYHCAMLPPTPFVYVYVVLGLYRKEGSTLCLAWCQTEHTRSVAKRPFDKIFLTKCLVHILIQSSQIQPGTIPSLYTPVSWPHPVIESELISSYLEQRTAVLFRCRRSHLLIRWRIRRQRTWRMSIRLIRRSCFSRWTPDRSSVRNNQFPVEFAERHLTPKLEIDKKYF